MPRQAPDVTTWIFSRLVAREFREPLIGDLTEEYVLRARSSSSAARNWYLRQICASAPHLLWLGLRRAAWPATLGVALLAYLAVGLVQVVIHLAIPSSVASIYSPLRMVIVFPMVLLIGFCAERLRRGAAVVLAGMMLLAMTAMSVWSSESAPLWYWIAYFVVGPAAALTGGALRSFRPARS